MSEPSKQEIKADRDRRSFMLGMEVLITLLGVVAIVGPEEAEPLVTRMLGLLLMLIAFLGLLVAMIVPSGSARRRPLLAWTIIAFATGAIVQWLPAHGLPSLGAVIGLLLVGHGLAASSVALRHWKTSGVGAIGFGLAASLMLLVGLALLFGKDLGDRIDEIVIGVDIVFFGAFLMAGRLLIEDQSRSPRTPSR